jgi:hypothetical protein
LNAAIPQSEWETGLDGQPSQPWKYTVVIYFINPATGELYTYMHHTVGAIIAFNHLKEAVVAMRILRGSRVLPVVNLSERPMRTKFGQKLRPHLEIVSWKTPGGETPTPAIPSRPTPQIPGPTSAPTSAPTSTPAPTPTPTTPVSPATSSLAQPREPKQPVNLADYTLAVMGDVKPVTPSEELNDEIGF